MTTASEIGGAQRQREINERRVSMMIEEFTFRWGPDSKGQIAEFTSHLHALMREVSIEAQQPFIQAAGAHLASRPFPPIVLPDGVREI